MFSSEQQLVICGETKKQLKKSIKFVLEFGEITRIASFYIDNHGYLVICECSCPGDETIYPFKANAKILVEQIYNYINDLSTEDILKMAGEEPDTDGSVTLGWELFYPSWYGEYKIDPYKPRAIMAIKPTWIVYGK